MDNDSKRPPSGSGEGNNRSVWRRRLALAVTGAVLAIALAALAGFAGRIWWFFELACHFRVQYFWGLLVGAVVLAGLRRRSVAVCAGILCVVHGVLLWPFYAPRELPQPGAGTLKVVSLNLNSANRRFAEVLRFIRDESPDIAVFLEVSERWGEVLTDLGNEWPWSRTQSQRGNFGVALYSKRPLDSRIEFLADGYPAVVATIDAGRSGETIPVTIFGTHPMRPKLGVGDRARNEQLSALAKLVAATSGARVVAGDLNATSWSPAFADFIRQTGLVDSRLGLGVQPSWPSFLPLPMRIPIDHCLVSPGIEVVNRRIGPHVGSDHLPVIVDLTVSSHARK